MNHRKPKILRRRGEEKNTIYVEELVPIEMRGIAKDITNGTTLMSQRTGGELKNVGVFLNPDIDWEIIEDSQTALVLIAKKKCLA